MIDTSIGVSEFGMVGLGTMGRNLLLNIADHGRSVSGYDLGQDKVDLLASESQGRHTMGFTDAAAFAKSLKRPRCITMLVPAGSPVDAVIQSFKPYLEPGDLIIDGGNSYFKDTDRRIAELAPTGIAFFGMGISGGESGARHGPSMMAGGSEADYAKVKTVLELVAAKAEDGRPCVARVGNGSAGHYVKMVHNGIEYGIMQLIAETYDLMKRSWGFSNSQLSEIYGTWAKSDIGGFLLEITETVLKKKDEETGQYLVDLIRDEAKEKGTGKWTSQDAMDLRVSVPSIDAAVCARELSDLKVERVAAAKSLGTPGGASDKDVAKLREALSVAMIAAYAQGMAQLSVASTEYKYGVQMEPVAAIWRAGCIIRSVLLKNIMDAYTAKSDLPNLLVDPDLGGTVKARIGSLRWLVNQAVTTHVPMPCFMASLAYIDAYTSERLPANLIQAQRDFFGAHTYERIDKPGVFHTEWAE
jgi:6-phosphogluconate dehydrogenase